VVGIFQNLAPLLHPAPGILNFCSGSGVFEISAPQFSNFYTRSEFRSVVTVFKFFASALALAPGFLQIGSRFRSGLEP
jgi:hypothetical protein